MENNNKLYKDTHIIVITGGVFSSLGKGITASSVGCLLNNLGYKVINLKFDPYVNVDPGTMSPLQHGEVFVTHDGGETDLDLGNYERFLNVDLNKISNLTTGTVYQNVIKKERNGDYLGKTVQIIPHITNEIIHRVDEISQMYQPDFIIVEIGGTVGDIESIPFIEAMRQMGRTYKDRVLYMHCVPVIKLLTSNETKTKPLQHSVRELMHAGISPDFLLVRSEEGLTKEDKEKIYLTTGVDPQDIIDVKNQEFIYDLPSDLYKQGLQKLIIDKFHMEKKADHAAFDKWENFLKIIHAPAKYEANIAVVGKYISNSDAYLSLFNGLKISAWYNECKLTITEIDAKKVTDENVNKLLKGYDAIIVPGGFGEDGIEGMIKAIKYARENKIPYLGICLGMQLACIEYARDVLGYKNATSAEFDKDTSCPIFHIIAGKSANKDLGGTLRLGDYLCSIKDINSLSHKIYQSDHAIERHRHRYEFNNQYKPEFEKAGLKFSGIYDDKNLVEIIELPQTVHPFFFGTQFHPEFTAKALRPQPIFSELIKVCEKPINQSVQGTKK